MNTPNESQRRAKRGPPKEEQGKLAAREDFKQNNKTPEHRYNTDSMEGCKRLRYYCFEFAFFREASESLLRSFPDRPGIRGGGEEKR